MNDQYDYEERAAIRAYDAGIPREDAEWLAERDIEARGGVFR